MSAPSRRVRPATLALGTLAVALALGPIATLAVQALADRWFGSAIVPQQFGLRGVRRAIADPSIGAAVRNSVIVALATVTIALALAWPAARALATDGRRSLQIALLTPLLVPPLALGEGLAPWFLRLGFADTLGAIVLAHLVTVLPYVTLALVPAFTPQVLALEQTAAALGAGTAHRLRTVTIPAVRRHLLLALALGFTVSWSQYGTSLVIGGGVPMLPVVLVPFVRSDRQIAAVLDLVFLAPPLLLVGLAAIVRQPGEVDAQTGSTRRARRPTTADSTTNSTTAPADPTNAGLVGS
jgi:putative spermidine/putrescine transport system permease protein